MLSEMMTEQDLANIVNRLQVPLIVQDILADEAMLTDDVRMGLHEILSDDQPDSALLCIALSTQKIAGLYKGKSAAMKILSMECDRIIAEYASIWLKNAQDTVIDDNLVFETLVHIPEDLECLAELLEACMITMQLEHNHAVALCDILATQARAQALVAQAYLDSLDMMDEDSADHDAPWESDDTIDSLIAAQEMNETFTDNVIPFPNTRN